MKADFSVFKVQAYVYMYLSRPTVCLASAWTRGLVKPPPPWRTDGVIKIIMINSRWDEMIICLGYIFNEKILTKLVYLQQGKQEHTLRKPEGITHKQHQLTS